MPEKSQQYSHTNDVIAGYSKISGIPATNYHISSYPSNWFLNLHSINNFTPWHGGTKLPKNKGGQGDDNRPSTPKTPQSSGGPGFY